MGTLILSDPRGLVDVRNIDVLIQLLGPYNYSSAFFRITPCNTTKSLGWDEPK